MWKVEISGGNNQVGRIGIFAGADLQSPTTNYANHIELRDVEVTLAPGIAQSGPGVDSVRLVDFNDNPLSIVPCIGCQADHVLGLRHFYIHGWDVGDPGQPSGACSQWTNTGTVTIAQNPSGFAGDTLITRSTGTFYGMTFAAGSPVSINGTTFTILDDGTLAEGLQNGTQNTQFIVVGLVPTAGTYNLSESNPPSKNSAGQFSFVYGAGTPVVGCGDDVEDAIRFHVDDGWLMDGYVEKIHNYGGESNALGYAFDNGPLKIVNNWLEGSEQTIISGGAPVDQNGGPGSDNEIRRNYFGKDLNYRYLTGGAGNSPAPPWGCGPTDGTASHNVCPFSYAIKNPFEIKVGHRNLVAGNIIENSWADGQQGFCILVNARTASGGAMAGVFNPGTGLPDSYIDNIRFESNWIRNCPEPVEQSNRAGTPSNGGGVSLPVEDVDWINNLYSNIADTNQFNDPGHEWEWTSGANTFTCAMSYTGSSAPFTITAQCLPEQNDITSNITKIVSVANVVSVYDGLRTDAMLSTSGSGTCIANGNSWTTCPIIISNHTGWNGSFAMTGCTGNWASDGTGCGTGAGAQYISYTDNINNPGTATLCDNSGSPKCSALLNAGDVTIASLAYKMTDISVGDGVNATNVGGGDTTCTTYGYAAGITAAAYAVSGTVTTGLTVSYQTNTQPTAATANCIISNGAGFPKWTTLQNNTFMAPNVFAIQTSYTGDWLPISNYMFNNVFVDNDSGHTSDVYCNEAPGGYEGTDSFSCWDDNTFEFYQNVLTGRNSSNWSVVNCPGGSCSNAFPVSVNCSGTNADPTCLGYVAFMGSDPAMTYPTGACTYDGSNPFDCPLMALPWASNFTFTDISYVGSSSYQTQGVNTTQLNTVMTQTEYICPVGANCGAHGPYPD